jgi:translation initiation factor 2 subunit 3
MNEEDIDIQANMNIGVIGHVAHGKSSIVKAITGIHTVKFKNELERNITIKIGYANAKIFKCSNKYCPEPGCFKTSNSKKNNSPFCDQCHSNMTLERHISFVDCPGHEILMATMLSSASIMDAALLVVAANEKCPQPQTCEHLAAIEIMKLQDLIIVQNKVDLVEKKIAIRNHSEIMKLIEKTSFEKSLVVPVSAQKKCNIDVLVEIMVKKFLPPLRKIKQKLRCQLIRSFDINKPGIEIDKLNGGVVGGSIIQGLLKIFDKIEIRPGLLFKKKKYIACYPLETFVSSLNTENNSLLIAKPGGLIGIGTFIDPSLTRGDQLSGQILGHINELPSIYKNIIISFKLFPRLLGIDYIKKKIDPLNINEILMINIGSSSTGGKIKKKKKKMIELSLTSPICCELESKITLSRRIEKHWRLVGWGIIKKGKPL